MYKIDQVIKNLSTSLAEVRKAKAVAQEGKLPAEVLQIIEENEASLQSAIDRLYKISMSGSEEPVPIVKQMKLDPSRIRGRRR